MNMTDANKKASQTGLTARAILIFIFSSEKVAQPAEVALLRQRRDVKPRNLGRLRYYRPRFSLFQSVAHYDMNDSSETWVKMASCPTHFHRFSREFCDLAN